jgi:hypothetical protein
MYDLKELSEREFENLTFDLVCELGLTNCVWRTPGRDVGRDIEGEFFFTDISGFFQKQKWYVECKRYTSSVDWPTVWNKISYAEAHNADVLLFFVSSSLSPQAIDQVNTWNNNNKLPIIRVMNGTDISNKLVLFPHLSIKYGFVEPTDANISYSLFPLVQLLLNTVYSLSSGLAVGVDVTTKADLAHAVTDLISVRIDDLRQNQAVQVYSFTDSEDGYDGLNNSQCIEGTGIDRDGIRAALSYIKLMSKSSSLNVANDGGTRLLVGEGAPDEKQKEHLRMISCWSNFNFIYYDNKIMLEY